MFNIIKKNYFLLISTLLFLYFFFNLLDGERGLISYIKKKNLLKDLRSEELKLSNKIESNRYSYRNTRGNQICSYYRL